MSEDSESFIVIFIAAITLAISCFFIGYGVHEDGIEDRCNDRCVSMSANLIEIGGCSAMCKYMIRGSE